MQPHAPEPIPEPIHIYLTDQVLAIHARTVVSGPTTRPSLAVLWTESGKPFHIGDGAGRQWCGDAAIVSQNTLRSLQVDDAGLLSVNFEPGHPMLPALTGLVGKQAIQPIDRRVVHAFTHELSAAIQRKSVDDLDALATELAGALARGVRCGAQIDGRVRDALASLRRNPVSPPSVDGLARESHLSADRLSRLLAEALGVPYKSYVLWLKYRRALGMLGQDGTLTHIAQAAGFFDQPHMTRAFMQYFGYLPSQIRQQGVVLTEHTLAATSR